VASGDISAVRLPARRGGRVNDTAGTAEHQQSTALPSAAPCVSIIIPVHNRLDLTRACLDSVFANADASVPFEVLVVDDCSTDATPEYLASRAPRVRTIRNEERRSFGHSNNRAALLAQGEYLCLLNNDTLVTPGWLTRLVAAVRRDPTIGVVGNRHLTPGTGLINHAGMVFDGQRNPVHLYPGKPADFPAAMVSREFQIVTAACWLVPKSLFLELDGFDADFRNGYEDVDFCLRVRAHGRKVFYAADSVIYHYGQSSPGRTDSEAANALYFRRKWGAHIASDLDDYVTRDGAAAASSARPEAAGAEVSAPSLAVGAVDIHFAAAMDVGNAFSWVMARLALACADKGIAVSLRKGPIHETIDPADRRRLQNLMARPDSGRAHVRWAHFWQPYIEQKMAGRVNAELFVHNYRYGPQSIENLDYWMRHTVTNRFRKLPAARSCLAALQEIGIPSDRCRIVPYGFSPEILNGGAANDRYRKRGFVFLAITNSHDPYRYGTDILLKAFEQAFAGRKDVVLVLKDYGTGAGAVVRKWSDTFARHSTVVHVDAFLTKEALIELYRGADAFVAPFRGEGFGMKILDACAVGLPVLAPHYGGPADYLQPGDFYALKYREVPVGPCLDRNETVVPAFARWAEVDCDDLARQLGEAMNDAAEARRRAARSRDFVLKEFSWERAAAHLESAIGEFEHEREQIVGERYSVAESKRLSVLIPTFNRKDVLTTCLRAYEQQTLPKDQWEILLVDDGSNYDVKSTVAAFEATLPIRLFLGGSNRGPGPARNLAIPHACGEIVFIAGDDIIPGARLLEQHLAAHERRPERGFAALGHIDWHPSVAVTPLMEFVTGEGGYQFAFDRLLPDCFVPHSTYFYTSNVSVKRALLFDQEELFSDQFRLCAFEDGEFGYRLTQSGMKLFYAPALAATHLHPMSDEFIYARQYRVGRMLVTYAALHPYMLEHKYRDMIRWLEVVQHVAGGEAAAAAAAAAAAGGDAWLEALERQVLALESMDRGAVTAPTWAALSYRNAVDRVAALKRRLFALRIERTIVDGMADEWFGVPQGTANPARDLLRNLMYADLLKRGGPDPLPAHGLPDRLAYIEALRAKRPHVASLLRTLVRLSTSIAKRLN
jgi:GT2 family glycosyltransferase